MGRAIRPHEGELPKGYRTLVVPYDFSAHARAALFTACDLARRLGSDLHLVHVLQLPTCGYVQGAYAGAVAPPPLQLKESREHALESLRDVARGIGEMPGKLESHVVSGTSVDAALCDVARELGADLLVMGTHGRTGLAHVFLGSVAERTLRGAPCPVLTLRAPEEEAGEGEG